MVIGSKALPDIPVTNQGHGCALQDGLFLAKDLGIFNLDVELDALIH